MPVPSRQITRNIKGNLENVSNRGVASFFSPGGGGNTGARHFSRGARCKLLMRPSAPFIFFITNFTKRLTPWKFERRKVTRKKKRNSKFNVKKTKQTTTIPKSSNGLDNGPCFTIYCSDYFVTTFVYLYRKLPSSWFDSNLQGKFYGGWGQPRGKNFTAGKLPP